MTLFAIIGHLARTDGGFSINDLPGSGGRMDVLCRCVNTSLFLSHDLRRDTDCYLVICGEPAGPKTVKFSGVLQP
jgi:tRNA (pseudouridine54-N1)-methyltransferase